MFPRENTSSAKRNNPSSWQNLIISFIFSGERYWPRGEGKEGEKKDEERKVRGKKGEGERGNGRKKEGGINACGNLKYVLPYRWGFLGL